MEIRVADSLEAVDPAAWNRLVRDGDPFLSHQFLGALERQGCLGDRFGWWPRHLLAYEGGDLLAAVPRYLKSNSYGELVFDWAWADAYQRRGLPYYPKQVVAVPYTPAAGQRILHLPGDAGEAAADALVSAALADAREAKVSSLHWLFLNDEDRRRLRQAGLFERTGYQFHWHNRGWADFDDFLASLSAKKRKNIRRERRLVRDAGVELELRSGPEMSDGLWGLFYEFYCATFARKSGIPTLSLGFFREIGATLGSQVLVVLARRGSRYVAGALMFRSDHVLYGRHWGASEWVDGLHFEACYYQGLEYCLAQGLERFEPGAQGEFKISRGFLPTPTWSCHWLAHPEFHAAIDRHTRRESEYLEEYMADLGGRSPYRQC